MRRALPGVLLLLALASTAAARAGGYFLISGKIRDANPASHPNVGPFAIVHPLGYSGQSGTLTVRFCVRPGSEAMIPALDWALAVWNKHLPKTRNCANCRTYEDVENGVPASGTTISLGSVLLHEVGHCIGLGHPNHVENIESRGDASFRTGTCDVDSDASCGDFSSFTDVGMVEEILVGADVIRGSRDDQPRNECGFVSNLVEDPDQGSRMGTEAPANALEFALRAACTGNQCCPPCPGPNCPTLPMQVQDLAWYRKIDNNPVVIDGLVIDRNTFTRSTADLTTSGSSYAANANHHVASKLGYPGTQAVMYSALGLGEGFVGLTADDVNMLRNWRIPASTARRARQTTTPWC